MTGSVTAPAIQSLERGLILLEAFRTRPALSLAELTAVLPIHRTSTYRLLRTLQQRGFVYQDENSGLYRLGPAMCELGGLALGRLDVRQAARAVMQRLAGETEETVQLLVRDGPDVLVVDGIESARRVKVGAGQGDRRPLVATAAGKCFLAAMGEAEVQALLTAHPPAPLTDNTIVQPEALSRELRRVRSQVYAVNDQESEAGACFVAAPIVGSNGTVYAALAIGAPADRLTRDRFPSLGRRLIVAAGEIAAALGAAPLQAAQVKAAIHL
jgi:DNA-binding IclR family transcriptional regulator